MSISASSAKARPLGAIVGSSGYRVKLTWLQNHFKVGKLTSQNAGRDNDIGLSTKAITACTAVAITGSAPVMVRQASLDSLVGASSK